MFSNVRREVTERLAEVFVLMELITGAEANPPQPDSAEIKILRGLFYVHLYAALEFCVNKGVSRYLQELDGLNVVLSHFEARALTVALANKFSSLRGVGEDKRWSKSLELILAQSSGEIEKINDGLFGLYLQNVWPEKLEILFSCLGIDSPIVPDISYKLYLEEIVDRRNAIAHGRDSAMGVGTARRSQELQTRLTAVNDTCFYILDCLEEHCRNKGSIQAAHREKYP
ncbi:TPA: hypothetical protein SMW11_001400 [Pseudomonas aeruginosa]|nr:hypothetical protein [Pseudomonas aeruginosa]